MKTTVMTCLLLLCGSGYAFAGPGSGEPRSPADAPSGRPSEVMDDAKCTQLWSMTEREGDTLSKGKAAPFVVNFEMVDADDDGKLSESEFKEGCKKGMVQEAAASQQPSGMESKGSQEPAGKATTPTTPQ